MAFSKEHVTFVYSIISSLAVGLLLRMVGRFYYKKEFLSFIGLVQIVWFCGFDTVHLLVMIFITIAVVKTRLTPRIVFVYCFAHRIIFASSKYLGLPRDEDNLANALMLTTTLKLITVAYEVDDYIRKADSPSENKSTKKWMQLDHEPSSYDIFCFMTCFVAIFTGPIYRYRTYYDMLHTYVNVPIRSEMRLKLKELLIVAVPFYITSIYFGQIKNEQYEEDWFIIRLCVMSLVVVRQMVKYCIVWFLTEWVCLFVGLGAYPVSTKPMPGVGPTELANGKLPVNETEFSFKAVTSVELYKFFFGDTISTLTKSWNRCAQWWLAYFVYSSSVIPRRLRWLRVLNVLFVSALWHGIKPGYYFFFMSFPIAVAAEEMCKRSLQARIEWPWLKLIYLGSYYIFYQRFVFTFFSTLFLLQYFEPIMVFSRSMYFYGYVMPVLMLLLCGFVELIFPKPLSKTD